MFDQELRQQIFNKVVTSLRKQGKQSKTDASCRYRLSKDPKDPVRCGIGHLISDEAYFSGLEGHVVSHELVEFALRQSGLVGYKAKEYGLVSDDGQFLNDLQSAHDTSPDHDETILEAFERRWKDLAHKWKLTYTGPDKVSFLTETEVFEPLKYINKERE